MCIRMMANDQGGFTSSYFLTSFSSFILLIIKLCQRLKVNIQIMCKSVHKFTNFMQQSEKIVTLFHTTFCQSIYCRFIIQAFNSIGAGPSSAETTAETFSNGKTPHIMSLHFLHPYPLFSIQNAMCCMHF